MILEYKFSLIIPTLNRTDDLKNLLLSLKEQTFKKFEVIIVDQNSDERLNSIISQFQTHLTIVHLKHNQKGASKARNAGIEIARGEILTFPDDDCEYAEDILEKVLNLFGKNSSLDGLAVNTKDKSGKKGMSRLPNHQSDIKKSNVIYRQVEYSIFIKTVSLMNLRFDENMGPGAATGFWCDEGPDLVLRLVEIEKKFMYFPDVVIYHPNPVKIYDQKAFDRSFKYGSARGYFLRKHRYPLWYVLYVWGLYVAGYIISIFRFNFSAAKYYWIGLNGRVLGYLKNSV